MAESAESNSHLNAKTIREAIEDVLRSGSVAALLTVVQSDQLIVGAKLLVVAGGRTIGDLGDAALNHTAAAATREFLHSRAEANMTPVGDIAAEVSTLPSTLLLFERIEGEPQLVVAGAGHVGASLARLAANVGYRVTLIDDRAEFVAPDLFSSPREQQINLITAGSWAEAVRNSSGTGRGVSIAIVTRGHKQDEDCLRAALASNADYIGMIGSKRRTNIVLDKLRAEGFAEAQLRKVRAPIGLDIGAISPEEVALAILAEIVAERRGGAGGSLSRWRRGS
jgi:xanthine dehydrogenase accessory factor